MKIYTGDGDTGFSKNGRGDTLPKNDTVFHLLGDLDEFNCQLGVAASELPETGSGELSNEILELQRLLGKLGALISGVYDSASNQDDSFWFDTTNLIEAKIDILTDSLPVLDHFIIPGGHRSSANLHLARAICRRMERTLTTWFDERYNQNTMIKSSNTPLQEKDVNPSSLADNMKASEAIASHSTPQYQRDLEILKIANRLSDFLFQLARSANTLAGVTDQT